MTKSKRTAQEKLTQTKEFVTMNGKVYAPLSVQHGQAQGLLRTKQEIIKKNMAMQRRMVALQKQIESGELQQSVESLEEQLALAEEIQLTVLEATEVMTANPNQWLLEYFYPEAKECGDLDTLDDDEFNTALNAIFEVNPSMGKLKAALTMNLQMNPTS